MKYSSVSRIIRILSAIFLPALILSCSSSRYATDPKDLSYIYNPTKNPFNPRYNIVNRTDETSVLSVKFFSSDLFFSEANEKGIPMALMQLTVKLLNVTEGMALADTAFLNLSIVKEEGKQEYIYRIPLQVTKGNEYVAEVKILDRLRLSVVQAFVPFNTVSDYNKYNFLARGHFQQNELFNPVLRVNEYINLLYLRNPIDSFYVAYYKPFKEVPYPPSMMLPDRTIDYAPDTVIALPYSETQPLMFPKEGIYMVRAQKDETQGYALMNFGTSFPAITTPERLIEPLAFLASPEELKDMLNSPKPKGALDDFWIKCGGNIEKARELIRIYYTRVLYSNYYFPSYKEGWRSDRGMIYIIYGPPDKVYKSADGENWGYRKHILKSTWGGRVHLQEDYLFFNFKKNNNVFSDNDYYLARGETPVTFWDQAVLSWRKGIVYRLDNPEEY
jgi:GWxTD domain-containing protein